MCEWKCGICGKTYTTEEYIRLATVRAVPEDTAPKKQHGFRSVCECGYIFHKDKWNLQSSFEIKTKIGLVKGRISTVFLELDHGFGDEHLWYETMIFPEGNVECYFQERYETKEEAKIGHARVLKVLKAGNYKLESHEWLLTIISETD